MNGLIRRLLRRPAQTACSGSYFSAENGCAALREPQHHGIAYLPADECLVGGALALGTISAPLAPGASHTAVVQRGHSSSSPETALGGPRWRPLTTRTQLVFCRSGDGGRGWLPSEPKMTWPVGWRDLCRSTPFADRRRRQSTVCNCKRRLGVGTRQLIAPCVINRHTFVAAVI